MLLKLSDAETGNSVSQGAKDRYLICAIVFVDSEKAYSQLSMQQDGGTKREMHLPFLVPATFNPQLHSPFLKVSHMLTPILLLPGGGGVEGAFHGSNFWPTVLLPIGSSTPHCHFSFPCSFFHPPHFPLTTSRPSKKQDRAAIVVWSRQQQDRLNKCLDYPHCRRQDRRYSYYCCYICPSSPTKSR